mgnify:CR=1 FL=1
MRRQKRCELEGHSNPCFSREVTEHSESEANGESRPRFGPADGQQVHVKQRLSHGRSSGGVDAVEKRSESSAGGDRGIRIYSFVLITIYNGYYFQA